MQDPDVLDRAAGGCGASPTARGGSGEIGAYLECQVLRVMERIKVVGIDDAYHFYRDSGR